MSEKKNEGGKRNKQKKNRNKERSERLAHAGRKVNGSNGGRIKQRAVSISISIVPRGRGVRELRRRLHGRSRHGRHAVPDRTFSESRPFARARIACAGVPQQFPTRVFKTLSFPRVDSPVANQPSQLYRARSDSVFNASRLQRSPHSSPHPRLSTLILRNSQRSVQNLEQRSEETKVQK